MRAATICCMLALGLSGHRVVPFAPGSFNNSAGCAAESADATMLRYGGLELQLARRTAQSGTDVFYTPLTVRRVLRGPRAINPLLNRRALASYRVKR